MSHESPRNCRGPPSHSVSHEGMSSPRASFMPPKSPRGPLHGAVTTYNQQATSALLNGVSPRAHLPQPPDKPPEWKISGELMNQKWGSVLRTLQPAALNSNSGNANIMGGHMGGVKGGAAGGVTTPRSHGLCAKDGGTTSTTTAASTAFLATSLRSFSQQQHAASGSSTPRYGQPQDPITFFGQRPPTGEKRSNGNALSARLV